MTASAEGQSADERSPVLPRYDLAAQFGLVFCRALSLHRAPGPGGRGTHLDAELEHVTVFL